MPFRSSRDYMFAVVVLSLLMLAAFIVALPALSQPVQPLQVQVNIDATDDEAAEAGLDPGEFTIFRPTPLTPALTVSYTVGGTADQGDDYVGLPGTATIEVNSDSAIIPVIPVDDAIHEGDETVIVSLTDCSPNCAIGSPASDTATIVADPVTIRATDPNAAEWGPNLGAFTITPVDTLDDDLTVYYTVGGTADEGDDYAALAGSVIIEVDSGSATITVTPVDDAIQEDDETVIVELSPDPNDPRAYTVGSPGSDIAIIVDDDVPIRIAEDPIGRPWLYLFNPISGLLFEGPNATGRRIVFFHIDRTSGVGRIHRGANATGEILFTIDFRTGRIWAGPNPTGPLLYTLTPTPSRRGPVVRVHAGSSRDPIVYTINDDDMYFGPNVTGSLVFHGNRPFWGPVQFLLPLLADGRIP